MEERPQISRRKGLLAAIGAVSVITIGGQFLNLSQEVVVAAHFGTSSATDAYKMALVIPTLIGIELAAIIGAVTLPVFFEQRKTYDSSEIFSVGLNFIGVIALAVGVIIFVLAPLLMDIVAGGFAIETRGMAASLLRLLSLGVFLTLISLFLSNILNAYDHFALPALQRSFLYGGILVALILLQNVYGIRAAALGFVVGVGAFVAVQVFSLLKKVRYSFSLNWNHPVVKGMVALAAPLVFYSLLNQVNVLIEKRIVSGFETGSLSALDFAFKLSVFFINFLVVGVNTVVFPTLSESFVREDHERISSLFHNLIKGLAAVALPATVVFIALGLPIVHLVFERGSFDANSTALTTQALMYYAIGLSGQACVSSLPRFYQAFKRNDLLLRIGGFVIIFNVSMMLLLSHFFGFVGIAGAASATALLHSAILFSKLRTYIKINHRDLAQTILKISIASLAFCGILVISHRWLRGISSTSGILQESVEIIFPLLLGGAAYILGCRAMRVEVVMTFIGRMRKIVFDRGGAA